MFQRVGAVAYKKDLTNTLALCAALDNPHKKFKSIHVAGTNGKGSSSHMLASVLQSAGYKTGLYTSPHLKEFTERIRVDGKEVSKDFVVDFVARVKPAIEQIRPSFFEITVAMAFDYFANQQVDIAVVEVGLGGRLDSTNVISPIVSLITNISWDHADILGDTLPKIAFEKAGIIKENIPVVISEYQSEVNPVFVEQAKKNKSRLVMATQEFQIERKSPGVYNVSRANDEFTVVLDLKGKYQAMNLAGVLATIDRLGENGFEVTREHLLEGLKHVTQKTGLKGRWQKIGDHPLIICDTGHNEAGISEVLSQIKELYVQKLHMVWGMVKDKDISKILELLPKDASYYFCEARIPRAMTAELLFEKASNMGLTGRVVKDVNEAIALAKKMAQPDDLIFVGGSTFVVAEVENL